MYALLGRTQDFREGDKGTSRDTGRQGQSPIESSEDILSRPENVSSFFVFLNFGGTAKPTESIWPPP